MILFAVVPAFGVSRRRLDRGVAITQLHGLDRHDHRGQSLLIYDRAWSSQGVSPSSPIEPGVLPSRREQASWLYPWRGGLLCGL